MVSRVFVSWMMVVLAAGCQDAVSDPPMDAEAVAASQTAALGGKHGVGLGRALGGEGFRACRRGPHRDFDFWVGRWALTQADQPGGTSRIRRELAGCLITEAFQGASGSRGRSLNGYDEATGQWIQSYVDDAGTHFRLTGGLHGQQMVMQGPRLFPLPSGSFFPVVDRVTWSVPDGARVRQLIELSTDGGETFPFVTGEIFYDRAGHIELVESPVSEACVSSPFQALDGWSGAWRIESDGRPWGWAVVTSDLQGCVIEVRAVGRLGYRSRSFLAYDVTTESWHRTYIDNRGNGFRLEGTASGPGVALQASRPGPGGSTVPVRNTIGLEGDRVIETWRVGGDGGPGVLDLTLEYDRR